MKKFQIFVVLVFLMVAVAAKNRGKGQIFSSNPPNFSTCLARADLNDADGKNLKGICVFNGEETPSEAFRKCYSNGMDLFTIESENDKKSLFKFLKNYLQFSKDENEEKCFVLNGFEDIDGVWYYTEDFNNKIELDKSSWADKNKNNQDKNCLEVCSEKNSFFIRERSCDDEGFFFCEVDSEHFKA